MITLSEKDVGNKIWSLRWGWGIVTSYDPTNAFFPVVAEFNLGKNFAPKIDSTSYRYTEKGTTDILGIQELYRQEMEVAEKKQPPRQAIFKISGQKECLLTEKFYQSIEDFSEDYTPDAYDFVKFLDLDND